jgi:hypothetical protein
MLRIPHCIDKLYFTADLRCIVLPVRYELNLYRLCGLVVRVPGYGTEKYCASCEVRTEFIYVM